MSRKFCLDPLFSHLYHHCKHTPLACGGAVLGLQRLFSRCSTFFAFECQTPPPIPLLSKFDSAFLLKSICCRLFAPCSSEVVAPLATLNTPLNEIEKNFSFLRHRDTQYEIRATSHEIIGADWSFPGVLVYSIIPNIPLPNQPCRLIELRGRV